MAVPISGRGENPFESIRFRKIGDSPFHFLRFGGDSALTPPACRADSVKMPKNSGVNSRFRKKHGGFFCFPIR
ncbi:MAG: hypothetical protein CSA68_03590 [Rhodobacterales bacterium]|nr:MAG: hypothetical protein CSA68_03590 [Rhodobacterales bacterium]